LHTEHAETMVEYMDVVDDANQIVGQAPQEEIYAKKLTHRIIHVFVINPTTKQVYFQKRSEKKSYLPGYYCTSAGGHVRAGETYTEAAQRELREELGLTVPVHKLTAMEFILDNHKRFIELFIAYAEDGFHFADGEVASGEFLDMDEAHSLVEKNEKIHPQLDVCYRWLYNNRDLLRTKTL